MDTAAILLKEKEGIHRKRRLQVRRHLVYKVPDSAYMAFIKRFSDVVMATILILLLLSWIIPVLAVLVRLSSRGPLFFRQQRIGLGGKRFSCIKFRTMRVNEQSDVMQAGFQDQRITKIGLFLRLTHIDELPQLFNVLFNDMSIVGPRPHMVYHDLVFSAVIPEYYNRHLVKPGITGLAQCRGYHGETRNYHSISNRTRLDLFYITRASFGLDMKILYTTLFVVPFKLFKRTNDGNANE